MDKELKKRRMKARLIALGVSLLMLAAAMGITLWQYHKITSAYLPFDLPKMIIINCVGAVAMYFIVCHFLKKDIKTE